MRSNVPWRRRSSRPTSAPVGEEYLRRLFVVETSPSRAVILSKESRTVAGMQRARTDRGRDADSSPGGLWKVSQARGSD